MVAASSPDIHPPLQRPLVLYMGTCPFCRASARMVARLDRRQRLAMLPFEDADATPYLDPLSDEEREESWHLFTPDGRHLTKGAATLEVIASLPAIAWLGRVLRVLRLTTLVTTVYEMVARNRGRLSRFMSGAPGPRRFP